MSGLMLDSLTSARAGIIGFTPAVVILLAGCYMPPVADFANVDEKFIQSIQVGRTTRAEVKQRLETSTFTRAAARKLLETDTLAVYEALATDGGMLFMASSGGALGAEFSPRGYRLLLEYDENDVVCRLESETFRSGSQLVALSGHAPPPPRYFSAMPMDAPSGRAVEAIFNAPLRKGESLHRLTRSPDGSTLVASASRNRLLILNLHTGQHHFIAGKHRNAYSAAMRASFDPRGRQIAVVGLDLEKTVRVYDLPTGTLQWSAEADAALWAPDNSAIATGGWILMKGGSIRLHEPETGIIYDRLKPRDNAVGGYPLAFSPDGRWLVMMMDELEVWDARLRRRDAEILNPQPLQKRRQITAASFSSDGRCLALASSAHVEVWEVEPPSTYTGPLTLTARDLFLLPYGANDMSVDLSADGRLLAASNGTHVVVWSLEPRQEIWRGSGTSATFTADGRHLLITDNEHIRRISFTDVPR